MLKSLPVCYGFAALLVCAPLLSAAVVPSGTDLEVRISTPIGSRISHSGDRVDAVVIAPVAAGRERLLLQGAILSGTVEEVARIGLGLKRRAAQLEVRFHSIQLRDGTELPLRARIEEIETAREHVDAEGNVEGIDPAANLSSGLSFLMTAALVHTELEAPFLAVKLLAVRSPDSEIYLPRGTELIVELTSDFVLDAPHLVRAAVPPLSSGEIASVRRLLSSLPAQAELARRQSSDLINLLLLGTRTEIDAAFRTAAWTGENRHSALALYRMYHCLVQRMGYSMAPMSRLTFNGRPPSTAYQKSLDTLAKRHHVRFWKQGKTDVWLGAASEDVAFTIRRMHVTHAIDPDIDNERAKVVNDLWFTGCVDEASLVSRGPHNFVAPDGGFPIETDGDVAVLRLRPCDGARTFPSAPLPTARARMAQAFRALGIDLLRANLLTVGVTTARMAQTLLRRKPVPSGMQDAPRPERPSMIDFQPDQLACSRTPGTPGPACSASAPLN